MRSIWRKRSPVGIGIEKLTEREENLAFLLALIPLKIIKLFDDFYHLPDKIITINLIILWVFHIAPLIIIFLLAWKIKSLKLNAVAYLTIGIFSTAFGSTGELTGATLLYLFCYAWGKRELVLLWVILSGIIIAIKYSILKCSIPEMLIYQLGYFFVFRKLFFLTWPKKQDIVYPMIVIDFYPHDREERELWEAIIYHIRHGFKVKSIQIASCSWKYAKKNLTADEIQNRIDLMREKVNASDKAQLIEKLYQAGILQLKKADADEKRGK